MTCTKCGYMMGPFDKECVRCKNGVGVPASASVPPPTLVDVLPPKVEASPPRAFLIPCPACHQQVSSQAMACPKCGQPIAQYIAPSTAGQTPIFSGDRDATEAVFSSNGSGTGATATVPVELNGFNWGAFWLSWIWAIGNNTWIGLLALAPGIGFVMWFVLGAKGNEWAWQNRRWESVEHFQEVQASWASTGVFAFFVFTGLAILAAVFGTAGNHSVSH